MIIRFSKENLHGEQRQLAPQYEGVISILGQENSENIANTKTSITIDAENKIITLRSAIGNPVPLFWGWNVGELIISDSASSVLQQINGDASVNEEDFDKVGLIESLLFDGPLGERTLFDSVKKVQCAEEVKLFLDNQTVMKAWRWLPKIQTGSELDRATVETTAKEHLTRLMDKVSINQALLPITGGLDSRLLAVLLNNKKTPLNTVNTYTFQRGWSFETWCAKKVTKKLGFKHFTFNLDRRCYKDFAQEVVKKSGGMVTGMHTHGIYCCEKLLPGELKSLPRLFGYFGDPITGAMTETIDNGMKASTPLAVFEKYKASFYPELVARFKDEIVADLEGTYDAFVQSGSPAHVFHEFWKIQQRQSNLITHLFNYHRAHMGVEVVEPFISEEFIDFFLSLPFEQRNNRALFKRISNSLFPDIFSLPSMHFPPGSFLSKIEAFFEKLESIANKISPAQEFFLSPFKYEQHSKNLQNYLAEDIATGVEAMSKIFGVPAVDVRFPLWKYSGTEKECYRLAALGYLLIPKAI